MKKKSEKCAVCGGQLLGQKVKYDQHWGDRLVIFEDVPAQVCLSCGEVWLNSKTVQVMDKILTHQVKPTKKIAVPVWSLSGSKAA